MISNATDRYQRRLRAHLAESRRLFPPGQWQPGDIREWALMQMESGAWFQDSPTPKKGENHVARSLYSEEVVRGWHRRLVAGETTRTALAAEVGCSLDTITNRLRAHGLSLPQRGNGSAPAPTPKPAAAEAVPPARRRQRQAAPKSAAAVAEAAPTVATAIVPASPTPPAPNPNGNGHSGDIQLAQAQAAAEWLRGLLNELQGAGAHVSGSVSVSLNLSVDVPIGHKEA